MKSDIDLCKARGWGVGTQLVGDEGYGPTVIEITALGEKTLLAKTISFNGNPPKRNDESTWTLSCRDWKEVPPNASLEGRGTPKPEQGA